MSILRVVGGSLVQRRAPAPHSGPAAGLEKSIAPKLEVMSRVAVARVSSWMLPQSKTRKRCSLPRERCEFSHSNNHPTIIDTTHKTHTQRKQHWHDPTYEWNVSGQLREVSEEPPLGADQQARVEEPTRMRPAGRHQDVRHQEIGHRKIVLGSKWFVRSLSPNFVYWSGCSFRRYSKFRRLIWTRRSPTFRILRLMEAKKNGKMSF